MIDKKRRSFASLVAVALSNLVGLGPLLAGEDLSFMDPIDFEVGRRPQSVAVGDFNGDKALDLVVANEGSNNVSILLGKGGGAFGAACEFGVGTNPYFVAVGDFNDDKVLDLAVANSGSNNVSILLGKGDGTFEPAKNFDVGRTPRSIAIGDFNGDGIPDLAVANEGSNNVSILFGRKDGTFAAGPTIGVDGSPTAVAVGDFNGDGRPDLAVAILGRPIFGGALSEPGKVSVLLGNGDGTFRPAQSYGVGANPRSLLVSDFNGDKTQDLAVANVDPDSVSVLLANGDGTFGPAQTYQVGGLPKSIAVGDFNGDGIPDLVTADQMSTVSVLIGQGDGTFHPTQDFWAGTDPSSVCVGDFNGDGRDDLAVTQNVYATAVSILLNNTPQEEDGVTVVRDVLYYDGQYHNPQRQILDVYLPPHATDFPVVFFVHGGRWGRHNKSMVGYLARTFAREGLAVVAINHRLTNGSLEQVVHPGHIVDVARAFAWTYHQIAAYGGNPDQIVLMGHSSGAHLVSLLATDRRYLAAHELSPDVIKGVIGLSGVYDFRGPRPLASYIFGDEAQRWEASPIRYVSERQPPVQLLYGGDEPAAVVTDSVLFYNALTEAKSEVELHEIPDRDHFDVPGRAARPGDPARELMLRFIAEHTK